MQSKLFRASLAGPSDRSGVATRIIAKIFSGTDLIPRHHDSSLEASRSIRSVHTLITSGRFRSSSEIEPAIDTHSYRHTPDRLVQPIFRPPSRRPPPECSPSISRRDAGLKMLCIMFYSGSGTVDAFTVSPCELFGIEVCSIFGTSSRFRHRCW
jgi:hypothetical protein